LAVLADGGGHATIAADALTEHGLTLARLSDTTKSRLEAILPPSAALSNPVDVAGGADANPAIFADCARILLEDPDVDGLLITGLYGGYGVRFSQGLTSIELETSDAISRLSGALGKPILVHSLYGSLYSDLRPVPLTRLRKGGIPVYDSLELAVRCLQALAEFGEVRKRGWVEPPQPGPRQPVFEQVLADCRREGRTVVLEHEARRTLAEAGIAMAPAHLVTSGAEAQAAFKSMGSVPVAMKIVSRDILHKSEANAVKLNLTDEDGVGRAFEQIIVNGENYAANADIAGVLVTPMVAKGGVETIIGVVRDPTYGPVMMFGLGGVLVEVLKDVVFRSLPLHVLDVAARRECLAGAGKDQNRDRLGGIQPVDGAHDVVDQFRARQLIAHVVAIERQGGDPAINSNQCVAELRR
jgi:acetyltransferase